MNLKTSPANLFRFTPDKYLVNLLRN